MKERRNGLRLTKSIKGVITFEGKDYEATIIDISEKGIYDFIIETLDDPTTLVDDQYKNIYKHKLMVNMPNYVEIKTDVSKRLPYVNELIDFHIKVKNFYKKAKKISTER